jgi:hypothetical protein
MDKKKIFIVLCLLVAVFMLTVNVSAADKTKQLPDPDGKPADMSKPVQVYILLGQSNMLGAGKIKDPSKVVKKAKKGKPGKKAGKKNTEKDAKKAAEKAAKKAASRTPEGSLEHATKDKGLYPYMIDDAGKWTVRNDVRNVRVMQSKGKMRLSNNEFMTVKGGTIGPEYGIGHVIGHVTDAPVMILKSCIGNRALGWDLLPPGSKGFEFKAMDNKTKTMKTWIYAGYKESPQRWEKGTEPVKKKWYAGKQYDDDIANAKKVLAELDKYYPGAKSYEVAGFFWWQGDRDKNNEGHSTMYGRNLVNLVKALRKDFDAPKAKFVCATLGQTNKDSAKGNEKLILDGMFALEKNPEFAGDVATVYSHPLSKGGASNSHYNGNAETYMNVGEAMGKAMVELLK